MRVRISTRIMMHVVFNLLLMLSSEVFTQTGKSWLERDAEIYSLAYANQDISTVLLYTHPKYLETYGNYEYRLKYIFDRMYGTVTDVSIDIINKGYSAGDDFLVIVMMNLIIEDQYTKIYKQIPLVGAAAPGIDGYSFVQPDDMTSSELNKVFPGFDRRLLPDYIPERSESK